MTQTAPTATVPRTGPDAFAVTWEHPDDAQLCWVWDPNHFPDAFTPLSIDHARIIWEQIWELRGMRPHERGRQLFVNGYRYSLRQPKPDPSAPPPPPDPVAEERKRRDEALALRLVAAWKQEFEPEIRTLCHRVRDRNYDALTAAEIGALLESCFLDAGRALGLTMVAAAAMFPAVRPLSAFCKEAFPDENADALVGTMVGGFPNYTADSESAVWRLGSLARRIPAVQQALLTHTPHGAAAELQDVPAAQPFLRGVAAYIEFYGYRPEMWCELTLPTLADDPAPLYAQIRRYVADPDADPRLAHQRAAERRRREVRRRRKLLAGDAEKLARFDDLLARAQQYVPVRENRAMWQLTATGVLRIPCLALGRKLHAAGQLDGPEDVFYLRLDELTELARAGRVGLSGEIDHRALIAERRIERARWQGVIPPLVIGTLNPAMRDEIAADTGRFQDLGYADERDGEGGAPLLRGGAASRGVVRGVAKVVHTLQEADKLKAGEVLICRTTSPSWTALVARAAAVVSDTGGILAHCAIVTREHAIPCVVGTGVATQRIRDGMIVTVDGTQGLVRLG